MKKIYVLFMAGVLALGAVSCSKDDDNGGSNNNNNNNNNNNHAVDVWAKAQGTYSGDASDSDGKSESNAEIVVTKINETTVRITPGANNTIIEQIDIPVFKNDTALYHQQGGLTGTFYLIANSNPPQVIYVNNNTKPVQNYSGLKK